MNAERPCASQSRWYCFQCPISLKTQKCPKTAAVQSGGIEESAFATKSIWPCERP